MQHLADTMNARGAVVAVVLAIALADPVAAQVTVNVPSTSNPYLSGMPNGSTCCSGDSAPAHSPVLVSGVPLVAGSLLTFSATGSMTFDPAQPPSPSPDGGFIFTTASTNGISGANWPANALMGVFLDSNQPNASGAPAALDFGGTGVGTSFATLAPALKQVFFIGDGRTGTGAGAAQTFVVPAGATRLFLGATDGFGWFNNVGGFTATVTAMPAGGGASTADIPALSIPMLLVLSLGLIAAAARFVRRR